MDSLGFIFCFRCPCFLKDFLWLIQGFPMFFSRDSYGSLQGLPMVFSRDFLWFLQGFPYCFPMDFLWYSIDSIGVPMISCGFPKDSLCFPRISYGSPRISYGFPRPVSPRLNFVLGSPLLVQIQGDPKHRIRARPKDWHPQDQTLY